MASQMGGTSVFLSIGFPPSAESLAPPSPSCLADETDCCISSNCLVQRLVTKAEVASPIGLGSDGIRAAARAKPPTSESCFSPFSRLLVSTSVQSRSLYLEAPPSHSASYKLSTCPPVWSLCE